MEAEKTAEVAVDAEPKSAEVPPVKLDEVRMRKTDAAPAQKASGPAKAAQRTAAAPAVKAAAKPTSAPSAVPGPPLPFIARTLAVAESYGYHAAGALAVLGVGWIIGANTFDNRANERRVAEALRALDTKIEMVSTRIVTGSEVAALKRNLDEMKQGLESSRRTASAISDLRSRFDSSEKSRAAATDAVFDKVAERVGTLGKEQGERLDKMAERLDGIERQLASQFPTASIPSAQAAPPARALDPVQIPGITMPMASSTPPAPARDAGHTTIDRSRLPENGYVLREVYNGIALVEGRRGLMEVGPGDNLPGAGRVRSIERRNRQWVVVTSNGVIDSNGY